MKRIVIGLLALGMLTSALNAQEASTEFKPTVKFKGFVQTWFSVGNNDIEDEEDAYKGFSLRRVRLVTYGNIMPKVTYRVQMAWDVQRPVLHDAQINFEHNKALNFTVGKFLSPGPKSAGMVSDFYSTLDLHLMQRPMATLLWNSAWGCSGLRDIGGMVFGSVADDKIRYYGAVFNAEGNDLFTPTTSSTQYDHDVDGLKGVGRVDFLPFEGFNVGAFVGFGNGATELIDVEGENVYNTFGTNVAYNKDNIYSILEFFGGESGFKADRGPVDFRYKYKAFLAEFGYRFGKMMPVVRVDTYETDNDEYDFLNYGFGLNYFVNKRLKFQGALHLTDGVYEGNDVNNSLFQVGLQYIFVN